MHQKHIKNTVTLISLFLLVNCGGARNETNTSPVLDLSSGHYQCVSMKTNQGEITIALDKINAPQSTANFLNYVTNSFYNNTIFHRVISNFMIQGGGFDQQFTKKPTNAAIINEADNGLLNTRGAIAMARTADPHSATSQFFINTVNNNSLNFRSKTSNGWGYAVFAWVVNGMDVVDKIKSIRTGAAGPFPSDVPQTIVSIQTIDSISCIGIKQQTP